MKAKTFLLIIALGFGALFSVRAENNGSATGHGSDPYIPTKIEWLAVEVNSSTAFREPTPDTPISITCLPGNQIDTIKLMVRYDANAKVTREQLDSSMASVKSVLNKWSKAHGWDSWLIVEDDVRPFKE